MDTTMMNKIHGSGVSLTPRLVPYDVRVLDLESAIFDNGRAGYLVTVGCYRETGTVILYDDQGLNGYHGTELKPGACIQGVFYRPQDREKRAVLVRGAQLPEALIGPELIPSNCAARPQELAALVDLVAQVQDSELRSFVRGIFAEPEVWQKYCLIPSSQRHHHNDAGGHLSHCLEVVAIARSWKQFDQSVEEDLLIVGGLLHDLGKVAVYDNRGEYTETGRNAHHDQLTIEMLGRHFPRLKSDKQAFDLVNIVRNLVQIRGGKGEYPKNLLQETLYHADCLSAASYEHHQAFMNKPDCFYWATTRQGKKWLRYPRTMLPSNQPGGDQPEW